MLYGAMNFPVNPILEELEVFSKDRDYLEMSKNKIAAIFSALHKDLHRHNS